MFKTLAAILSLFAGLFVNNNFEVVSIKTNKRMNANGITRSVDAQIFYSKSGKMVTYLDYPQKMVVINDAKGQLTVHYVEQNSVAQKFDNQLGTENSQLYYFLQNKTSDLGLGNLGFKLDASRFDDGLLVSKWLAPEPMQKQMSYVELVHEKRNPIFMGYFDAEGKPLKKMYFYQYQTHKDIQLPGAITEINYIGQDSTVSKTSFSNIEFDTPGAIDSINYQIPESATLIKQ